MTVTRVNSMPNPEPEEVPAVNREALNDLLSIPYDEPDMADVERVCDEVRHEVPITDPRWLVSTQPDREPEPKPDIHWMVVTGPRVFNACGAPSGSKAHSVGNAVTCPDCLDTIVRTKCLAPDPDDVLGIGIVCKQKLGADGTHEGLHDWQKPLTSALTNQERDLALAMDTPSDVLPRRVPGEALRVSREVIERWPA